MAEGGEPVSQRFTSLLPQSFASIQKDQLTFIKHLGSGGFGTVDLYQHVHWGKVAVKQVIYKQITSGLRQSFFREAQKMLHAITSPSVVSVRGMFDASDGGINIVMEYLEYGNLRHFTPLYMVTKDTDNPDVWRTDCWPRRICMIVDMILGMNFLHTLTPPIVHRDLKLENIFVGQGFQVKIGDLGLSVSMQSKSAAQHACKVGTITHIPPEILKGTTMKATKAWDIYSFGITLFEFIALTLENDNLVPYPHWANDALLELWARSNVRPDDSHVLQDTPELVVNVMRECWNIDRTKRPSFQELKDKFTTLYEEKYESSIESADTQIMLKRSLHRSESNASSISEPTGLTLSDEAIPLHNGSAARPRVIKSKQPVQASKSEEGHESVDSNHPADVVAGIMANQHSGSTQPSSTTNGGFTDPSEQAAGTNGMGVTANKQSQSAQPSYEGITASPPQAAVPEMSDSTEIAPLKSCEFKSGSEEAIQRQYQSSVNVQPSSAMGANTGEASVPERPSVQPSSATAGNHTRSSQQDPVPMPLRTTKEPSSEKKPNFGAASVPKGSMHSISKSNQAEINSLKNSNRIPPLMSAVTVEPRNAQAQFGYERHQQGRHGDGATRFSGTSSRPQQVTGQDEAGCFPNPWQHENPYVADQPGNMQQQELCRPFQDMNLQGNSASRSDYQAALSQQQIPGRIQDPGMAENRGYASSSMSFVDLQRGRAGVAAPAVTGAMAGSSYELQPPSAFYSSVPTAVPQQEQSSNPRQGVSTSRSANNLPGVTGSPSFTQVDHRQPSASSRGNLTVPHAPRSNSLSPNFPRKLSDPVITGKHIMKIEKYVGLKYRKLGRVLSFADAEIDTIENDHRSHGTEEVVHQLLTRWIGKKGRKATKSTLVAALRKAELSHLCDRL